MRGISIGNPRYDAALHQCARPVIRHDAGHGQKHLFTFRFGHVGQRIQKRLIIGAGFVDVRFL